MGAHGKGHDHPDGCTLGKIAEGDKDLGTGLVFARKMV